MQCKRIDAIADQLVQQHFPEILVFLVDVVGNLIMLASEFAQRLPIVVLKNAAQLRLILGRGNVLHYAGFFSLRGGRNAKRSIAIATPSSSFVAVT